MLRPLDVASETGDGLELHRVLTFLDLVVGERLELRSEAEEVGCVDEPLGRIVLVPLDGVAEVLGEFVVLWNARGVSESVGRRDTTMTNEVVVALADGDQGGEEVILGCVLVVKRRFPEPMGERVDAKRRLRIAGTLASSPMTTRETTYMVNECEPGGASEEIPTAPISPSEARDNRREDESHPDDQGKVPAVLPFDDLVDGEIANVGDAGLPPRLEDHPADVGPDKSSLSRVRIEFGVGVAVMGAMASRPPLDRAFDGAGATKGEKVLEGEARGVGSVSPKTMVAGGDACGKIVASSQREVRSLSDRRTYRDRCRSSTRPPTPSSAT